MLVHISIIESSISDCSALSRVVIIAFRAPVSFSKLQSWLPGVTMKLIGQAFSSRIDLSISVSNVLAASYSRLVPEYATSPVQIMKMCDAEGRCGYVAAAIALPCFVISSALVFMWMSLR